MVTDSATGFSSIKMDLEKTKQEAKLEVEEADKVLNHVVDNNFLLVYELN